MLGCGNVGAALVQLVERQADVVAARTGLRLEVTRVAVRNVSKERDVALPEGVLTRDAHGLVADPDVDLVVETIGGIEPARELIRSALDTASRSSRRTRSCSPTSAPSCTAPPTTPASTCCSKPPSPAASR